MTDDERGFAMRQAALIMSDLLASALGRDDARGRQLYCWERQAIEWIECQQRRDPETIINHWTGSFIRLQRGNQ